MSELAKGLGRFTGEFKKGRAEIEDEIKKAEEELKLNGQPNKQPDEQ